MNIRFTEVAYQYAVLVVLTILSSCTSLEPKESADVWIDVRTAAEYDSGHMENAVNIPYDEIDQRITEVVKARDAKIYLYCGSGHRAELAKESLTRRGYTDVTNAGGYYDLIRR